MEDIQLKVKMFGCFDITLNGKTIFLETTANNKAIALLRFLLAQKDKVFTAEAIAQNVWPENEYYDEKKVIRTYIHRLRKLLSQENFFHKDFGEDINIVNIKGGYKAELSDRVRLDIDAFGEYKDAIMSGKDVSALTEAFFGLNDIYSGEFLEECRYDHWVIMLRNYYLRTFSSLACRVLSMLWDDKDYSAMIDVCERSLKICELDENINLYFLQALVETDQITSALSHYSVITSKMYAELSITPSEKLREMYAKIKAYKKQEENIGTLTTETIDRKSLFIMLDEIVKTYLESDQNKYSVAYIEVLKINEFGEITSDGEPKHRTPEEKTDIAESLKYALEYALRKNDMYTINEKTCSAIVVLYDAKINFYNNIKSRISNAFYSRYTGFKYKINVEISQVTSID